LRRDEARALLEQSGVLRRACDIDLLAFFATHPRAMLASETLAAFLGYELADVAGSLDTLLSAGLVARRQTPAHAARLYIFTPADEPEGWLPRLVRLATTREGRLALRAALAERDSKPGHDASGSSEHSPRVTAGPQRLDHAAAPRVAGTKPA
jgi:hypothetical protein